MKKWLLSLSVVVLFAFYSIFQKKSLIATGRVDPVISNALNVVTPTSVQTPYRDGVYTGKVADAFYGNIQIQLTVKNHKISDVTFLQYPNDRERSQAINTYVMPYLKEEAIAAQSANVDIISGATATSQAFIESLGSALAQAR